MKYFIRKEKSFILNRDVVLALSVLEECKAAHFTPYAVLYFVFTVAFAHVVDQVNPPLISEFAEKSRDVQYISEQ